MNNNSTQILITLMICLTTIAVVFGTFKISADKHITIAALNNKCSQQLGDGPLASVRVLWVCDEKKAAE